MKNFARVLLLGVVFTVGISSVHAGKEDIARSKRHPTSVSEKAVKALLAKIKEVTRNDYSMRLRNELTADSVGLLAAFFGTLPILGVSLLVKWAAQGTIYWFTGEAGEIIAGPAQVITWIGLTFCLWLISRNSLKNKWEANKRKDILEILQKLEELGFDSEEFLNSSKVVANV